MELKKVTEPAFGEDCVAYFSLFLKLITSQLFISSCRLLVTFTVLKCHVAAVIYSMCVHTRAYIFSVLLTLPALGNSFVVGGFLMLLFWMPVLS